MPGLNAALFSATQALAAHSRGLEIAGKNLANINNPAYARQRVILGDRGSLQIGTQTLGMGVEALGVQQIRDGFLDRQVTRENSLTAGLQATQGILERAQAALGQQLNSASDSSSVSDSSTSAAGGIADALSNFFNAFDSLASAPGDVGEKQLLLQKAGILVERINTADSRLAQVQSDANDQITADLETANGILEQIAHLNNLIANAENGTNNAAVDLRDQRQSAVESLAQYFNFETREVSGSHGQIDILAKDGSGAEIVLVTANAVTGPVTFDGTNFSGGAPATVLGLSSGSFPASVAARDGAVQAARDGLASLASQLTTAVNAAYNPTGSTGDFFSATPSGLITLQPGLTTSTLKTTDSGNAGANELLVAVAKIANTSFGTGAGDAIDGTPAAHYSSVVSGLGQSLASANSQLEDQALSQQAVTAMRDGVSGVSQDEELADLMLYQRSFQASARYLNIVDSLLDVVVNRLGIT